MNTKKIAIIAGIAIIILLAGYVIYSGVTNRSEEPEQQNNQNTEESGQVDLETLDLTTVDIPDQPDTDIRIRIDDDFGPMLVGRSGITLYFHSEDGNMESNCSGECAIQYPPFFSETISIGSYIGKTAVSTFTRSDGSLQISYEGKPLYTFSGDVAAGDINGVTEDGVWLMAQP
jgi:predicted lipoprotein with Yx(FWY)xxD motif